jgi:N-acetylglucosamine-6-phosphate deacetylase
VAHTAATAGEAIAAYDNGFNHVTHFYNATSTFHKKNGIVYSGVVEATYISDDVTVELIGDGCHIPKESMLLARKIKGADKICLITDAMRAAGTDHTTSILGARDTGVPVVVKDDVAQLTDLSSYAGSIATMDRCLRTAHVRYGIPLEEVSRMLSLTPARLMGVDNRLGSLEVGKDADVVIMNCDFQVEAVFTKGNRFA